MLERKQDHDLVVSGELRKIRVALGLEVLADAVIEHKPLDPLSEPALDVRLFPTGAREAEHANLMVCRYREVESILFQLPA